MSVNKHKKAWFLIFFSSGQMTVTDFKTTTKGYNVDATYETLDPVDGWSRSIPQEILLELKLAAFLFFLTIVTTHYLILDGSVLLCKKSTNPSVYV